MKEGWSGTSRWRQRWFSRDGARALHPGGFWRSLSRHSLRDVSKPRRPSTQPLVNGSQSTACLQAPALSPHSKGDIRTAPPSRSRVKNDYPLIGMLSRGKFSPSSLWGGARGGVQPSQRPHPVFALLRHPSPQGGGKETPAGSGPAMMVLQYVMRGLDSQARDGRLKSGQDEIKRYAVTPAPH